MMNRFFWRVFKITSGWILLIAGLLGFFLPILQGFLLTLAGLSILASESRWARDLLAFVRKKIENLVRKWRSGETAKKSGNKKSP